MSFKELSQLLLLCGIKGKCLTESIKHREVIKSSLNRFQAVKELLGNDILPL